MKPRRAGTIWSNDDMAPGPLAKQPPATLPAVIKPASLKVCKLNTIWCVVLRRRTNEKCAKKCAIRPFKDESPQFPRVASILWCYVTQQNTTECFSSSASLDLFPLHRSELQSSDSFITVVHPCFICCHVSWSSSAASSSSRRSFCPYRPSAPQLQQRAVMKKKTTSSSPQKEPHMLAQTVQTLTQMLSQMLWAALSTLHWLARTYQI